MTTFKRTIHEYNAYTINFNNKNCNILEYVSPYKNMHNEK